MHVYIVNGRPVAAESEDDAARKCAALQLLYENGKLETDSTVRAALERNPFHPVQQLEQLPWERFFTMVHPDAPVLVDADEDEATFSPAFLVVLQDAEARAVLDRLANGGGPPTGLYL